MNAKNSSGPPKGPQTLDECLALIKSRPPTAANIGEALSVIQTRQLYGGCADFNTFIYANTKLEPEHALRIIGEWKAAQRNGGHGQVGEPSAESPVLKRAKEPGSGTPVAEKTLKAPDGPAHPPPMAHAGTGKRLRNPPDFGTTEGKGIRQPDRDEGSRPGAPAGGGDVRAPHTVMIELSAVTLDEGLQCRVSINRATVAAYSDRMKAGDVFPPLDVFEIDGVHLLVDGWQRYPAAKEAGLTQFPVRVHQGTRQDAIRFAVEANSTHGQPLTNKDKRRAVEMVLRASPEDSDHAIAELCKVSHTLVAKVRRQLATVASCGKRTGRDGKARRLPRKRKSRQPKSTSAQPKEADAESERKDQPSRHNGGSGAAETEAEDSPNATRQPAARFDLSAATARVEHFLFAELERWPEESRWLLGDQLHKFADINCVRPY